MRKLLLSPFGFSLALLGAVVGDRSDGDCRDRGNSNDEYAGTHLRTVNLKAKRAAGCKRKLAKRGPLSIRLWSLRRELFRDFCLLKQEHVGPDDAKE